MSRVGCWDRKLWGVEMINSRGERHLLGAIWDDDEFARQRQGDMRASEPARVLLFCTRGQARMWCRERNASWRAQSDSVVRAWRAHPVRVRETVKVIR